MHSSTLYIYIFFTYCSIPYAHTSIQLSVLYSSPYIQSRQSTHLLSVITFKLQLGLNYTQRGLHISSAANTPSFTGDDLSLPLRHRYYYPLSPHSCVWFSPSSPLFVLFSPPRPFSPTPIYSPPLATPSSALIFSPSLFIHYSRQARVKASGWGVWGWAGEGGGAEGMDGRASG